MYMGSHNLLHGFHDFFCLFITSSPLKRLIQPHKIFVFVIGSLFMYYVYVSHISIQLRPNLLLLMFVFLSLLSMLFLSSLYLVFYPYSIYVCKCPLIVEVYHMLGYLHLCRSQHKLEGVPLLEYLFENLPGR